MSGEPRSTEEQPISKIEELKWESTADAKDMRGGKPLTVQARAAKFGSARSVEDSASRASVFIATEGRINGEEQLKVVTSSSTPMDYPKQATGK